MRRPPPRSQRPAQHRVRALVGALPLGVAAMLTPVEARPRETVAMPYACRFERGELRMERAAAQTYRVLGDREHQSLRICAATGSANCQTIELHKFAFACGGTRVTWLDAADAIATGQPWRTSVSQGRMVLRFRSGGLGRDRQPPLTLPVGFAPELRAGLRFAAAESPPKPESPPAPSAEMAIPIVRAAVTSDDIADVIRPLRLAPPSEEAAPRPSSVEPSIAVEVVSAPPAVAPMGHGWSATVVFGDGEVARGRWGAIWGSTVSQAWLAALGLAALLLSATAVAARHRMPKPVPPGLGAPVSAADELVTDGPAPAEADPPPPPPPLPRVERQAPTEEVAARQKSLAQPPPLPALPKSDWDVVLEMRTTAGALLELVRQIIVDHVPDGALREVLAVDLAAIAARLDGPELARALAEGRLDLVHPVYAQAILDLERARTIARIEHQRMLETTGLPRRLPGTVEEACSFLGVNPRASESVVKKVVDALRQNWHPDLADDEPDRAAREERIKRINAAWDLIRAR